MKKLLLLIIFVSFNIFSQSDSLTVKNLKGQIIHAETKKYLSAAHILNLNTVPHIKFKYGSRNHNQ